MLLTEKMYWILLIAGFSVFSGAIWFWVIPIQILEYNLAVNLFTSSVFMVLTVLLLSWLFNVRERREWNNVKTIVFRRIEGIVNDIGVQICWHIKDGMGIYTTSIKKDTHQERHFCFYDSLSKLPLHPLELDELKGLALIDENNKKIFEDFKYELDSINAYFKFLSPTLVESLMKVRNSIKDTETSIQNQIIIEALPENQNKKISLDELKDLRNDTLLGCSICFSQMIEEFPTLNKEIHKTIAAQFF